MHKLTQNETKLIISIAVLIVLGSFTLIASRHKLATMQKEYQSERQEQEAIASFFNTTDNAKAVYVYDATNKKVLYERNAETPLPLASVTKLATALTVNSTFTPDQTITISDKTLAVEGDNGLLAGEVWKRDPLLGFMLVISSNDAASAFKEAIPNFMDTMNAYAKQIGLEHTTFYNPSGLDAGGKPGAVGTAKDMSTLILHFLDTMPEIAAQTTLSQNSYTARTAQDREKTHTISNTNDLSVHIDTLLASKTGYTKLAGGNLAIVYRVPIYGYTVAIVVLGSTREGRFVDIERYMEGVENYFKISKK